jgi:hypothetical protein
MAIILIRELQTSFISNHFVSLGWLIKVPALYHRHFSSQEWIGFYCQINPFLQISKIIFSFQNVTKFKSYSHGSASKSKYTSVYWWVYNANLERYQRCVTQKLLRSWTIESSGTTKKPNPWRCQLRNWHPIWSQLFIDPFNHVCNWHHHFHRNVDFGPGIWQVACHNIIL